MRTDRPSRWSTLARVDLWPELGAPSGIPESCAACSGRSCEEPPRGGRAWGVEWSRCPRAEVRDDAHYQAAARLWALAQISPLADWPHGWAAWVVDAVSVIDSLVRERQGGDR